MKKKLKILFIILILTIFLLPVSVQANSFKLNVQANKTTVKPGETVEISLNLSDINAGELGINTVEGVIEYDNTIFEEITSSNIQSLNNWSITYNNEETEYKGKFLAVIIQDGVTENQDIGKITFKVKNSAKNTNTSIKIKNILSNDGNTLIEETDKQVSFTIQANASSTVTEDQIDVEHENLSTGTLPQTGDSHYIFYIIGLILIIVSIIIYIRYKKIGK